MFLNPIVINDMLVPSQLWKVIEDMMEEEGILGKCYKE